MKRITQRAALALIVTAIVFAPGCSLHLISYLLATFRPPKEVKALYELPADKVVLVLAENRSYVGSYEHIKRQLTEALNAELMKNGLANRTIPYDEISRFRLQTPSFHNMPITEVCSSLKADIVIYVNIDKFLLKDDTSDIWHGQMATRVQVKDTKNRLWPKDLPGGHEVEPIDREPSTGYSNSYPTRLANLMASQMADRIAKLFYNHRLSGIDGFEGRVTDDQEKMLQ